MTFLEAFKKYCTPHKHEFTGRKSYFEIIDGNAVETQEINEHGLFQKCNDEKCNCWIPVKTMPNQFDVHKISARIEEIKRVQNKQHLTWIYERLIYIHKENPHYDYMIKLKQIIDEMP